MNRRNSFCDAKSSGFNPRIVHIVESAAVSCWPSRFLFLLLYFFKVNPRCTNTWSQKSASVRLRFQPTTVQLEIRMRGGKKKRKEKSLCAYLASIESVDYSFIYLKGRLPEIWASVDGSGRESVRLRSFRRARCSLFLWHSNWQTLPKLHMETLLWIRPPAERVTASGIPLLCISAAVRQQLVELVWVRYVGPERRSVFLHLKKRERNM